MVLVPRSRFMVCALGDNNTKNSYTKQKLPLPSPNIMRLDTGYLLIFWYAIKKFGYYHVAT